MTDISSINGVSDGSNELYTPTTEEVRADYCLLADVSRPRQMQFDRWLAEVKKDAYDEGWLDRTLLEDNPKHRQGETE